MRNLSFFLSPRGLSSVFKCCVFLLAMALGWRPLCAQTPEEAVRTLARRVAEVREMPQSVAVEWTNASSLPESESIVLREIFLQEFTRYHAIVPAVSGPATVALRVSLRETPTRVLILAQVSTATGVQVRMADLARAAFLPVMTRGNGWRLTKQLLWQQPEPILDAREFAQGGAVPGSDSMSIFLLKPDAVAIFREENERLSEVQELPFNGYKYASRALRGEMAKGKDGSLVALLSGLRCTLNPPGIAGERWTIQCAAAANDPKGETKGEIEVDPKGDARGDQRMEAKRDKAGDSLTIPGGPSVALTSSCDEAGSWTLVGEAHDWSQPDRLLLVKKEMKREEAVASVEFPGPVRTLTAAENGKSALTLVFDLVSGSYELYRVAMVCGR